MVHHVPPVSAWRWVLTDAHGHNAVLRGRALDRNRVAAATYETLGELDRADRSYTRAKSGNPRLWQAFNGHGNVLKQLGAVPEALHSFRTGIELEPTRAQIWYNYGVALQETRRWAEALAAYDNTIALEPSVYGNDSSVLANRGLSLLHLPGKDRAKEGEESLRRAVHLQGSLVDHPSIKEVLQGLAHKTT